MADDNLKPIRVTVLGREYGLRVSEEDEAFTRRVASFVDERMQSFRDAHPEQAELTTAVMTALSLAEALHEEREEQAQNADAMTDALDRMADRLNAALTPGPNTSSSGDKT
jgi:cell division protein ZapA